MVSKITGDLGIDCSFLYGPAGIDVKLRDNGRTKIITIDPFEDDEVAYDRIVAAANDLARLRGVTTPKIIPVELNVDTTGIDRLSIGSRLYDLLTFKQLGDGTRINLLSAIEYDKDTKTILIDEDKLLETLRYANWPTQAEHIELVKRR